MDAKRNNKSIFDKYQLITKCSCLNEWIKAIGNKREFSDAHVFYFKYLSYEKEQQHKLSWGRDVTLVG